MRFSSLLLFLLVALKLHGQNQQNNNSNKIAEGTSINGSIRDRFTNKAIEGASVTLKVNNDTVVYKIALTNDSGSFSLDKIPQGIYRLHIKHQLFKEYKGFKFNHPAKATTNLPVILMDSLAQNLKEVTIKSKSPPYIDIKIDRTVVDVSSRLTNVATNALEVLSNTPSVEVNDNQIALRGKQGITIYVDNKQILMEGNNLAIYLRSIPSSTLDKIELMPIPPAKYHARGNSGVINIITKKNKQQGWNGNLNLSQAQGRYPKSDYSFNTSYKTNKLNVSALASYSSIDNAYDVQGIG